MSTGTFASGAAPSTLERNLEELEAQRTVGLTRVLPADSPNDNIPEAFVGESPTEARTKFEVRISAMSNGLDGGQGVMEGEVEIMEYVNDEYVGTVTTTLSIVVEADTPLSLVEDRFLTATKDTFARLAAMTMDDLRENLGSTRKTEDLAYQSQN